MNLTINGIPDVPHETPAGVDCGQCGHALTVGDRLPGNADHLRCPVCDGLCDEGLLLADWFDAAVAAAPRTMHPHASDLRGTSMIATASVNGRERLALKDAAREAAHGESVEFELSQVGPEPSDLWEDE